MHKAAPDIFKVDDENGMVALYKKVPESHLAVGFGDTYIAAKFLGYARNEEAGEIQWFKEILASSASGETGEAA